MWPCQHVALRKELSELEDSVNTVGLIAPLPRVRATITKCIERGMESAEWY